MEPVANLTGKELNEKNLKPSTQIQEFFDEVGNRVYREGFGEILLNDYGVGGVLNHRPLNRAKMVSLAAVPEVLKKGREISRSDNWKGRGYTSIVFAAPVTIANETVYVAAVVDVDSNNRFYLNECVDSAGNYVRIKESPSDNTKTGLTVQDGLTRGSEELSNESIAQSDQNGNTQNDGRASTEVKNNQTGQITVDSTEEQRYEILKDATIEPAEVDYDKLEDVEYKSLNGAQRSEAKKTLKKMAKRLKINAIDLQNSKISFPFRFSNKSQNVSENHQIEYGGSYQDFAKVLTCISDVVDTAVLIETHTEKKVGTSKENPDLKQTYVLLGAARDGESIIPVQMEVKEYLTADNGMYLTVALSKIIESEVGRKAPVGNAELTQTLFSDSEVSIRELIGNVNVKDGRFLKYAPDGFLSDEQRVAKQRALQRQAGEYAAYTIDGKGSLTIEGDIGVSHESTDRDNADTMDDATKAMMWEYMKRHGYDKKFRYSRHLYRDYVEKHGLQSPRSDAQTDDGFSPDTFPERSDSATAHAAREIQRERGTEEAIDYVAEQFVAGRISSDEAYQIWQELRERDGA